MYTAVYEKGRGEKQAIKYNNENSYIHGFKYLSACPIY